VFGNIVVQARFMKTRSSLSIAIVVHVQLLRAIEQGPNAAGHALLGEKAGDSAQWQGQKACEELNDVAAGLGEAEFPRLGVDQELDRQLVGGSHFITIYEFPLLNVFLSL
jgi:hypothetical protein